MLSSGSADASSSTRSDPTGARVASGSFASVMAIRRPRPSPDRPPRARPRAADPVASLPLPPTPLHPLPAPPERRRVRIPVPRPRLEPADDLLGPLRMLAPQRPALQDPLDALGHVQPRPAQRGI